MTNLLTFPDGLLTLAAILFVLLVVAQLVYLLLPDDCEPVDEIREARRERNP